MESREDQPVLDAEKYENKASHPGGVWERCICTVRKVLNAITKEQVLDDERLYTLMCKVEAIVNGRPITKVSDDRKDLEALTPNHLLLLLVDESSPRCSWPLGRIVDVHHNSKDKLVRSVSVRMKSTILD